VIAFEMAALILGKQAYIELAAAVLAVHGLFILWVIFGALLTRSRPWLRWPHVISLIWGIFIEIFPWSCPLTVIENALESRAGIEPYQGGFLLHYLDALVYPNLSAWLLTVIAVAVCGLNLFFYAWQFWKTPRTP
jgi:hypothetical protein